MLLVSLEFGGFLIKTKIIIVDQNINKTNHPEIKAT